MGNSKSKAQFHPPPPGYPYAPVYPPYGAHPGAYGPGYSGPGFIPPQYLQQQHMQMPMPQLAMPVIPQTQRRREKKKKRPTTAPSARINNAAVNANAQAQAHAQAQALADSLPPGFIPTHITPNPPDSQVNAPVIPPPQNTNAPPPLFTPGATNPIPLASFDSVNNQAASSHRRASTPFVQPQHHDDDDEDDEDDETNHAAHHRTQSRSYQHSLSRPRRHTQTAPLQPVDPTPLLPRNPPNPLPEPPRDLYSFTPYKHLLSLPNTTALLTATSTTTNGPINPNVTVVRSGTNPGIAGVGAGMNVPVQKSKTRRGLFRFGSRRQSNDQPQQPQQTHIQFVPVPIYQDRPSSSTAPPTQPVVQPFAETSGFNAPAASSPAPTPPSPQRSPPPDLQRSNTPHSHVSRHSHSHHTSHQPPPHQSPAPSHSRTQFQPNPQHYSPAQTEPSPSVNIFPFDQQTQPGFLNHSPHRVMYGNQTYPTATHLHEALKYIDQRPDLAERIRWCPGVQEVYPLSASFQPHVRPDWSLLFMDKMEEVVWNKFRQHKHLRQTLLATRDTHLVYAEADDVYWGTGRSIDEVIQDGELGPGENRLGTLLMKIRDRLRTEGPN